MAVPGKQYGLILPKKTQQKPVLLTKLSVFADDSDEEVTVAKSLQKEEIKKKLMKQTKLEMHKALEEDATVYEYDSIYDDMQQKKAEESARLLSGQDKKPKYIASLMKAVEIRKREQEKRMEKKIQKERESEEGKFADKEAFVTSAYKQKLQERAEEEEQEQREAALEAALDVTKQKDLTGFYRHLLNQTVGEEKTPECSLRGAGVKQEESKGYPDETPSSENNGEPTEGKSRSRTPEPAFENMDADSDFEIDSDDDEEDKSKSKKKSDSKKRETGDNSEGSEADSKKNIIRKRSSSQGSSSNDEKDCHQKDKGRATELKDDRDSNLRKKESSGNKDKQKVEKYKEREYERETEKYKSSRDRGREKESRQRERDYDIKDKKRDERDDRPREKDKKDRERRREKEREERYTERRGKEREEKYTDKGRERQADEKQDKHSERGCEKNRCSVTDGYTKERGRGETVEEDEAKSSDSLRKDSRPLSSEKEKSPDVSDSDKHADSNRSPAPKRKVGPEKEEEGVPAKAPKEQLSKFSKRSTEETVMTARERFLARQMARIANKSYIEKEED